MKKLYSLSIIGFVLMSFGHGWLVLSLIIGMPMNILTIIGVIITAIGSAIVIKTLSTLKKIQVDIIE
jgi:hypothetical protein|tara:strand:+ start:428 stop:628 length:201 start_codon:yes stop_codon:yes gene_type:complete